jgi:hypothetical protein
MTGLVAHLTGLVAQLTGLVAQSVMYATDMSEFRMVSMVIGPQNSAQT